MFEENIAKEFAIEVKQLHKSLDVASSCKEYGVAEKGWSEKLIEILQQGLVF